VHNFYRQQGELYDTDKVNHAYTSLLEILNITPKQFTSTLFKELLQKTITTKEWMCKGIYDSRAKDYNNPFRKMVYETNTEMNNVIGKLEDNSFIQDQLAELDLFKKQVKTTIKKLSL
jgi:hypothetical protein